MAADVTLVMKAENSDHLKKVKEVQEAHRSLNKTVVDNQKREKGLIEDIEAELTKLQAKQKKAYTIEDIEKYNRKIAEAKTNLEEYNKAGLQVEKTQQSMTQTITKWALSIGGAAAAVKLLGDAFKATTAGLNIFNTVGAVTKQILNDIVTTGQLSIASIKNAIDVQRELNALRMKDTVDMFKATQQQVLYNKYYFEASDRRKTDTERILLLNKAMDAHNKMIEINTENILDELSAVKQLLDTQPGNEKLLQDYGRLSTELLQLESERYSGVKRMESLRTGMEQEAIDKRKKMTEDWYKEIDEQREKDLKAAEDARQKDLDETAKDQQHATDLYVWQLKKRNEERDKLAKEKSGEIGLMDIVREKTENAQESIGKIIEEADKKIKKAEVDRVRDAEDEKQELRKQSWQTILESEQAIFDIISINIDNNLYKELNALDKKTEVALKRAGDDEKKKQLILANSEVAKLEIEKKYRREQQKIAIAQTVINTAVGISKTFADYGYTPPAIVANALLAALMALQIGVIKSQKFAKGGWTGDGGQRDETGERVAGIVHEKEFVTKKGPASKYREVLEAINRDDKRAILTSFNKIDVPEIASPNVYVNSSVENSGPNRRLDTLIAENRRLNAQLAGVTSIQDLGGKKIIKRGSHTRIVKS